MNPKSFLTLIDQIDRNPMTVLSNLRYLILDHQVWMVDKEARTVEWCGVDDSSMALTPSTPFVCPAGDVVRENVSLEDALKTEGFQKASAKPVAGRLRLTYGIRRRSRLQSLQQAN